jgi:hypothetical protein
MKVKPIGAAGKSGKSAGTAHGLIRQAEEVAFHGASAGKSREHPADRRASRPKPPADVAASPDASGADPSQGESTSDGLAPRIGQYVDYVV